MVLFEIRELNTLVKSPHLGCCDSCANQPSRFKKFIAGVASFAGVNALVAMLAATLFLTIAAWAQSTTTTDRVTQCKTDAATDTTTCTTQPNYSEELPRAQATQRADDERNDAFWQRIGRERREGQKHVTDEGKGSK